MTVNIPDGQREIDEVVQRHGATAAGALLLEEVLSCKARGQLTTDQALRLQQRLNQHPLLLAELPHIASAVDFELRWNGRPDRGAKEKAVREQFFACLSRYLPGAEAANAPHHAEGIPDGFVRYRGCLMPVEVKPEIFNGRALSQLMGYMRIYGAKGGIAVAPRLSAELPPEVFFAPVAIGDVSDPRFGNVHSYHESVLREVLPVTHKETA